MFDGDFQHVTYHADKYGPAETCDRDAWANGYCYNHQPQDDDTYKQHQEMSTQQ